METRSVTSGTRPSEIIRGPTLTLCRSGIVHGTEQDEDGTTRDVWTYTEIAFEDGEYDGVRDGTLPEGAEWTPELRRIERSGLLDGADRCIMEAEDYIAAGENQSAWTAYVAAVHQYKMDVRATASAPGFPAAVTYPAMPVQP